MAIINQQDKLYLVIHKLIYRIVSKKEQDVFGITERYKKQVFIFYIKNDRHRKQHHLL